MRAPAELGGLQSFRNEAVDRPGVDESVEGLRMLGALGVAFGDVDALDAQAFHELAPFGAAARLAHLQVDVACDVEECLLDQPRHHTGIGAAAGDRSVAAGIACLKHQHLLA